VTLCAHNHNRSNASRRGHTYSRNRPSVCPVSAACCSVCGVDSCDAAAGGCNTYTSLAAEQIWSHLYLLLKGLWLQGMWFWLHVAAADTPAQYLSALLNATEYGCSVLYRAVHTQQHAHVLCQLVTYMVRIGYAQCAAYYCRVSYIHGRDLMRLHFSPGILDPCAACVLRCTCKCTGNGTASSTCCDCSTHVSNVTSCG
jgi:hypothetical protein